MTYCPRSKLSLPDDSNSLSSISPLLPNKLIKTRASVPAPNLSPVYVETTYRYAEIKNEKRKSS